ncbi:MAG: hypothetical protein GF313_02565 [Caldithrix sp.]|nr:hypothetical protein [Caldithrix sp.]
MKTSLILIIFLLIGLNLTPVRGDDDLLQTLQKKVSPNFVRTPVTSAMRVFARQHGLNVVIPDQLEGSITVQLTNVTLESALNTILKSMGYHYVIEDDIILVKSMQMNVTGELSTKLFTLNYLDAFRLENTIKPLLSSKGKTSTLLSDAEPDGKEKRASILVVTDYRENIKQIEQVVAALDKAQQQVQIEVRLVETNVGSDQQIGLDLPRSMTVSMTGSETTAPVSQGAAGQQSDGLLSAWYELPNSVDELNLGVLTFTELKATLNMLKDDTDAKLISNPKVTTMNNKKAHIKIGTTIPVPEISRGVSGDLFTYKEKDVSMSLEVVPLIGNDGNITLTVHPQLEEIIGYTGPDEAPQPITSNREVQTTVIVRDGETVAIGGLVKNVKNKTERKLWLLGDIPVLGYLFTHTTINTEKKDLLIFITTKIMN